VLGNLTADEGILVARSKVFKLIFSFRESTGGQSSCSKCIRKHGLDPIHPAMREVNLPTTGVLCPSRRADFSQGIILTSTAHSRTSFRLKNLFDAIFQ
jgi:hypothetical protein